MYRDGTSQPVPPTNLRHRYQAGQDRRHAASSSSLDGGAKLELSMHLPSEPFGNRFEVLRRNSPPLRSNEDRFGPPNYRRPRYSRGSKEAKRRRDARRSRRKLEAVRMLDEELSRNIDRTLAHNDLRKPVVSSCAKPTLPTNLSRPLSIRAPPTPPQLPYLNFGGLDMMDELPPLPPRPIHATLPTPESARPQIPSWCPALPAFADANLKWSDLPLFFDLSKLPEPVELPLSARKSQEVQLWRPKVSPQPKKQSRFFPSPNPSKPNVRLPPTACKLHNEDKGIQALTRSPAETSHEPAAEPAETATANNLDQHSEAHAANLWRILSTPTGSQACSSDSYINSFFYRPVEDAHSPSYGNVDHRLETVGMPSELDNTEIPFVHGNSLTGFANERADFSFAAAEEPITSFKFLPTNAPLPSPPVGLNELVIDQYLEEGYADAILAALDVPPLPSSPHSESSTLASFATTPAHCDTDDELEHLTQFDAHYNSEQALFKLPSPVPKPAEEDIIDVADFLAMGHAPNCWCRDCDEPPELVDAETPTEEEEWEVDFGLQRTRSPSISWGWEDEWDALLGCEEDSIVQKVADRSTSGDTVLCTPSSVAHRSW